MQTAVVPSPHARAATGSAAVSARDVVRRYGEGDTAVEALRGVSVDIAAGQPHRRDGAVRLRQVDADAHPRRARPPTAGEVRIAGVDITDLDDTELTQLRRDHIGFIFQFFNLLPMLTAAENIVLPLKLAGVQARHGVARGAHRRRSGSATASAPPVGALGRPAAARRRRPRARLAPDRDVRRRADRQPRLHHQRRDPRPPARLRRRRSARPRSWSPTTRTRRRSPTACCSSPTAHIVRDLPRCSAHKILETLEEVTRPMIGVALKGLAARKLRALLTAFAVVIGVVDDQRHLHPHRHDAEGVRRHLRLVLRPDRRRHRRQGDRRGLHERQRAPSRSRCWPRSRRCPRSRPPAARSALNEANKSEIIGRDGKPSAARAAAHVRARLRHRAAAVQPAQAQERRLAAGPTAGRHRRRHAPTRSTSRSATTVEGRHARRRARTTSHRHRHVRRRRLARRRDAWRSST